MRVHRVWLRDIRNYVEAMVEPAPGLTVVVGANGQGKTNLLEAFGYLANRSSFRGVPPAVLVRQGAERGVIRAEAERDRRDLLLEAEIVTGGRDRYLLNRQPVRRREDLAGGIRVSVFTPDDLELVKGGPAGRRSWVDDALAALHPREAALLVEVERVVRQRTSLLRQLSPTRPERLTAEEAATLDVWDRKLVSAGSALGDARAGLLEELEPGLAKAYHQLAGDTPAISAAYRSAWREEGLAAALAAARPDELRRGVTLAGPHRDDVELVIAGLPARTHASQGEQRTLALAMRLAVHVHLADRLGVPPVLLLDDVFSELDPHRSAALIAHLPPGQAILTTAGAVPPEAEPELVIRVSGGRLHPGDQSD